MTLTKQSQQSVQAPSGTTQTGAALSTPAMPATPDTPAASDNLSAKVPDNPLGIAGLEFVEFASPRPRELGEMFEALGFRALAKHISKQVTLYCQGDIRFLVNGEPDSFAERYAQEYGVGVCALGLRVFQTKLAFKQALSRGAWPFEGERVGPHELRLPAVQGIGQSHFYFIDRWEPSRSPEALANATPSHQGTIYDVDFEWLGADDLPNDIGLLRVDHLSQTVGAGRMDEWVNFYRELLGFREIHLGNAADASHERHARVVLSPCGTIRIPLYEEGDELTRVMHHYLPEKGGEGVQHIALTTNNLLASISALRARGLTFLQWPESYYSALDTRLPGHGLDLAVLRQHGVLVDGSTSENGQTKGSKLFLHAFLHHEAGDMFFELVERRGHDGFGEGSLDVLARDSD